jgi:putative ABC transport system permease protein
MTLTRLWLAGVRANPGRTLLSIVSIAMGVALGSAVHVINQSAIAEMQQAARALSGDVDLSIRGGRTAAGAFVESALDIAQEDTNIAIASPIVEASVPIGKDKRLKFIGLDVFRAPFLQPGFDIQPYEGSDRFAALRGDHVFLNRAAIALLPATEAGARPETLSIEIGGETKRLVIAGTITLADHTAPLAVIDIAAAQELFGLIGKLSRIDLRLTPGANAQQVTAELTAALPPGVTVVTPEQVDQQSASVSRAYRINLTVLSLVALFTGGFLVFATQSLSVARRRSEFALYRTLGLKRGELMRALLTEGALQGLVSGVVGVAVGLALATLVLSQFGADLGSGFFAGVAPAARFGLGTIAFFVFLGVAAGVAGAWLPARGAALEPPARGLKGADTEGAWGRVPPTWIGLSLLAVSAVLLPLPAFDNVPWTAYGAIAAMLLGTLALCPALCAWLLRYVPRTMHWVLRLATQHVRHAPAPAAAAITGVVASFSLLIAMLIMVMSFRSSLEHWLTGVLDADLYVRLGSGETQTINSSTGAAFQGISAVKAVDALRYRSIVLDPSRPERLPVTLIARPIRADVLTAMSMQRLSNPAIDSSTAPAWISEAVADLYGYRLEQRIQLPLDGKLHDVVVAGVWRDYARSYGAIVVDRTHYLRWTGDEKINDIALRIASPNDKSAVIAAIRRLPRGEQFEIADAAEIRQLSLKVFDRSFAVTYALEFAAILVGLAGISATYSAQAWARRREFGVLRHLGVTRKEIAKLLATEGTILGALGALVGLLLGVVIALILIFVVNRQSFHWSMELHMPWVAMGVLALVLVGLTSLSAVLSGRVAMSRQAVLAVKEDQ